jgi:N-acyl-D-amino-acid deacylase
MHVSKAFYRLAVTAVISCSLLSACSPPASHDVILRGGNVYDGSGGEPFVGDVAIDGDKIVGLGDIGNAIATLEIDVTGLAVAPGFVNMMSYHGRRQLHGTAE